MQSLSPDTLWVVSTFVSAKTLSAMTRVSKEWRCALVEHERPWAYDKRFPSVSNDSKSVLSFMFSMRILASEFRFSHTYPVDLAKLDPVCASVTRVIVNCACTNLRADDLFLPPRAETYTMLSGCNCVLTALVRRGLLAQAAIRYVSVKSYEAASVFRRLRGSITHVCARSVVVRPDDYPTAHTLVYFPSSSIGYTYYGIHPRLVLDFSFQGEFRVLHNPGMFGPHRQVIVAVVHNCADAFLLLHLISALDRGRVSVLCVFDTHRARALDSFRYECETLEEAARNLGLCLVCRDTNLSAHARNAWWTEADALVAMALEPTDRRVRARIE